MHKARLANKKKMSKQPVIRMNRSNSSFVSDEFVIDLLVSKNLPKMNIKYYKLLHFFLIIVFKEKLIPLRKNLNCQSP